MEELLARFETAVSRHREANANFSRSTPGEISDALRELKDAKKAILELYKRALNQEKP